MRTLLPTCPSAGPGEGESESVQIAVSPLHGNGVLACKRLAEAHGRRIWVESRPTEGAIFCLTLPLEAQEARQCQKDPGT